MPDRPLAIVAGAGPGLGAALLARLEAAGHRAVGLTRSGGDGRVACDLGDAGAVGETIGSLIAANGAPKIVVHNPAALVIRTFAETRPEDFETCWRSMVLSAANLAHAVIGPMTEAGGGAFIVSGATASLRGGARFSAFASAKFALRGLTQSLAREHQPAGLHVVHVILDGIVDTEESRSLHGLGPERMMNPNEIAEAYLALARQPRSVWSHEVDLRPRGESF